MSKSPLVTLLYIEDNDEIRTLLASSMRQYGFNVLESDNTDLACDLFHSHNIDIVITDLRLPSQSGMDFVRCLRNNEFETPVIITTAYSDKDLLLDAIHLDVSGYLIKPFKTSELFESIEKAIKKIPQDSLTTLTELHHGYTYDSINKLILSSDGKSVQLSKKEYLLIELLLKHKNQIVPYAAIEKTVWNNLPMSIEALRTMVRTLRKKSYPTLMTNVNAHGYKIEL